MFRYSLKKLLLATLVAAAFCAALASPSLYWTQALRLFALLSVLSSVVVGLLGRGSGRAFGVGFAVFGGVFFYLVTGSDDWTSANKAFPLFDLVLDSLHTAIHGAAPPAPPPFVESSIRAASETDRAYHEYLNAKDNFYKVGHLGLAVLFGLLGGVLAVICHSRSQAAKTE